MVVNRDKIEQFESADVSELLVGITSAYLNKFVTQKVYGITASVQRGKLRAQRRLFSREDVFAIALVWLLFESGLRTKPMRRVLNQVAGTRKADANIAARKLLESGADYLVVVRQPRGPAKEIPDEPQQETRLARKSEIVGVLQNNATADVLVIPIAEKFRDLKKRMEILFPGD